MVYELNAVDKRYIYQLISNVHLPVSNRFDSWMHIHTGNQNNCVILAKEFQQHLKKDHCINSVIDQGKYKKDAVKENRQTNTIMLKIIITFHTKI